MLLFALLDRFDQTYVDAADGEFEEEGNDAGIDAEDNADQVDAEEDDAEGQGEAGGWFSSRSSFSGSRRSRYAAYHRRARRFRQRRTITPRPRCSR